MWAQMDLGVFGAENQAEVSHLSDGRRLECSGHIVRDRTKVRVEVAAKSTP